MSPDAENIKNIVHSVIQNISTKNATEHQRLQNLWESILTKKELLHTMIAGLKEETIIVSVDSPAWRYQMSLKKDKLLQSIQKDFPEIKKISFRIGKVQ